jgi:hypothetical protein
MFAKRKWYVDGDGLLDVVVSNTSGVSISRAMATERCNRPYAE